MSMLTILSLKDKILLIKYHIDEYFFLNNFFNFQIVINFAMENINLYF